MATFDLVPLLISEKAGLFTRVSPLRKALLPKNWERGAAMIEDHRLRILVVVDLWSLFKVHCPARDTIVR